MDKCMLMHTRVSSCENNFGGCADIITDIITHCVPIQYIMKANLFEVHAFETTKSSSTS